MKTNTTAFRAHVSAAPLKHLAPEVELFLLIAFRAHVSAAPLKPSLGGQVIAGGITTFRAHVSAAPLKPLCGRRCASSAVRTFRAHVSAAPLKRRRPGRWRRRRGAFRAHVSAAPLKLLSRKWLVVSHLRLSALT